MGPKLIKLALCLLGLLFGVWNIFLLTLVFMFLNEKPEKIWRGESVILTSPNGQNVIQIKATNEYSTIVMNEQQNNQHGVVVINGRRITLYNNKSEKMSIVELEDGDLKTQEDTLSGKTNSFNSLFEKKQGQVGDSGPK